MITDNDLIRVFLPILQTGVIAAGYTNVLVKQANQPTQQGINTSPTVYFFKVSNKRYGFLRRDDVWDPLSSVMVHTEAQVIEATFQCYALVLQNPRTPYGYTASDLINEVAAIVQSDSARATLIAQNIGILRVLNLTNPYFKDDRDQFEASPSFDFTLTYEQDRVSETPVLESTEYNIKRV